MPGRVFHMIPIQPVPENTHLIPAGPVTFGVEYRLLDAAATDELFARADPDGTLRRNFDNRFDEGLSVHVFDAAHDEEMLRFDCFDDQPHYHYIYDDKDDPHLDRVDFDELALGDMYPWVMQTLRAKLPAMVKHTGRHELAAVCSADPAAWSTGLDDVERHVASLGTPARA